MNKKNLKKQAFPKGYGKRFDKFVDSLHKKQYFEFMALDEIRRKQINFLIIETKNNIVREVLKLIKAWNGYGDPRFPDTACEVKDLVREINKLKKPQTQNRK